jgi:hypothetical protein
MRFTLNWLCVELDVFGSSVLADFETPVDDHGSACVTVSPPRLISWVVKDGCRTADPQPHGKARERYENEVRRQITDWFHEAQKIILQHANDKLDELYMDAVNKAWPNQN